MTTFYSFDVRASDAEILVTVNGIPVELFTSGQSGGGPMNVWMFNGANRIVFEMTPKGENARGFAGIDVSGPEGFETLVSFEWPEHEGPAEYVLDAQDLPAWSWLRAEPVPGAEEEVTAAVARLHAALEEGKEQEFRDILAAMYANAATMATPEQIEQGHQQMWSDFRKDLQPLGDLAVTAFRDGQVYRVLDAGGMAPIQSVDDDGGIFSTGQWWGKIDGSWQLLK